MTFSTPRRNHRRPAPARGRAARRSLAVEPLESRRLMANLLGIDVSYFQGSAQSPPTSINWTSVKNSGETFAYIRASYGTTSVDDDFTTNATHALAAGMYVGYYHFAYYNLSGHTPTIEADHFWNTIAPYMAADGKHLMPFLDIEEGSTPADGETLTSWVDNFQLEIQKKAAAAGLSVVPMIYISASPAGSYFTSDTNVPLPAINYPVDIAQYPNTNTYTPSDPPPASAPSGSGIWQNWQMWQYSSSGSVPGISGRVDMDVLNGDANSLKNYFVQAWAVGAEVTADPQPTTYSTSNPIPTTVKVYNTYNLKAANDTFTAVPASTLGTIIAKGAAKDGDGNQRWQVQFSNGVTGWVVQDYNYVVQSMSGRWPLGSYVTSRTVTGKVIQGPLYVNGVWRWQVQFNNGITGWDDEELMTTNTPGATSAPSPASSTTAWLTSVPATFTWTAGANDASYNVYLDGVLKATVTTNSWTPPSMNDGAHTWRVDAINAEKTTTGTTWNFQLDRVAPLATYGAQTPALNSGTFTFTVTYSDATSGVGYTSLNTGDVIVTGPNGFSQTATFVSVDTASNGTPRTATYSITAPGGTWGTADNGTYTVSQVASQVKDVAGNFRAAGTIGTFAVGLPPAYLNGSTLYVDYPAPETITVTATGGNIVVGEGGNNYTFPAASVTAIAVNTTSGDDVLSLFGNIPAPISVAGTGGSDTIALNANAEVVLATDVPGDAVTVGSGATLPVNLPLHLGTLTIDGGLVTLASGGAATLAVGNLSIVNGGSLDLADNALVWNYAGASPIDTLRTYLHNGRNGGTWDGTGGISSSAAAGDATHTAALGYLEASDLGVTTFAGADADGTTLVVKYTDAGDVNLDGKVNADDYALTDRGFARGVADPHWLDGDFDYDAILGAGDYLLLDTSSSLASGGSPSPALLAAREAAFGPEYARALLAATEPAPTVPTDTFSDAPIICTVIPSDPAPATPAVTAAAPVAVVTGPKKVHRNKPAAFKVAVPGAPSGRFTYKVDWNGDGVADQTVTRDAATLVLTHKFARAGKHTITFWVTGDATGLTSDAASLSFQVV